MKKPKITVIGSSNTDLVVKTPKLPAPGETILGSGFVIAPGGKGANQSLENFRRDGIGTDFVFRDTESPSGVALIFVDDGGENMIVVAQGANARLSPQDIDRARPAIEAADMIVLQLETPLETVEHAVAIASQKDVPVILNPAPGRKLERRLIEKISCLTPNETEAAILTGIRVTDDDTARKAGTKLLELGAGSVVVTMGKRGAMLITTEGSSLVPVFAVHPVDATAAGDAFTGGLAYAIASGRDLRDAVEFANAAAALAVTKMGAQPSMPTRDELERFLDSAA